MTGTEVSPYATDWPVATRVLEAVAQGQTLIEVAATPDMPTAQAFLLWAFRDPGLFQQYEEARRLSSYSLEEEALSALRAARRNPATTALDLKVLEALVSQLRWSATKRNPQTYSDKAAVSVTVPVQINTSLDLAGGSKRGTSEYPNIYELNSSLVTEVPKVPGQDLPKLEEAEIQRRKDRERGRIYRKKRMARDPAYKKKFQDRLIMVRENAAKKKAAAKLIKGQPGALPIA